DSLPTTDEAPATPSGPLGAAGGRPLVAAIVVGSGAPESMAADPIVAGIHEAAVVAAVADVADAAAAEAVADDVARVPVASRGRPALIAAARSSCERPFDSARSLRLWPPRRWDRTSAADMPRALATGAIGSRPSLGGWGRWPTDDAP